jgi:hypothetical protein
MTATLSSMNQVLLLGTPTEAMYEFLRLRLRVLASAIQFSDHGPRCSPPHRGGFCHGNIRGLSRLRKGISV